MFRELGERYVIYGIITHLTTFFYLERTCVVDIVAAASSLFLRLMWELEDNFPFNQTCFLTFVNFGSTTTRAWRKSSVSQSFLRKKTASRQKIPIWSFVRQSISDVKTSCYSAYVTIQYGLKYRKWCLRTPALNKKKPLNERECGESFPELLSTLNIKRVLLKPIVMIAF